MKQFFILITAATLASAPAQAQDSQDGVTEGFDLMEEGAKLLLRGLLDEMDPAIEDLRDLATELGPQMQQFADDLGPALAELIGQVDDLRHYDAPEFLPNGDIIIRRREAAPEFTPQIDEDTGDVEL